MGRDNDRRSGRSRYNSRGGRGYGRSNSHNSQGKAPKELVLKFSPQTPGKGIYAPYATVKEAIVRTIQKQSAAHQDVAKSLKDMKLVDLAKEKPKQQLSKKTDPDANEIEQKALTLIYADEMKVYKARVRELENGMKQAYAIITADFCTKNMMNRLESLENFDAEIFNNPIALLEQIKSLVHNSVRAQYPLMNMTDSLLQWLTMHQPLDEELTDYVKRFKQLRDVAKAHLGTEVLYHFIENQADYKALNNDAAAETAMKKSSFEEWCAYLFIRNANRAKYGSVQTRLAQEYSMGTDKYPKALNAAADILANHTFDPTYKEALKKRRDSQRKEPPRRSEPKDDESVAGQSFAQQDMKCYACGKKGHSSRQCKANIPYKDWVVTRAIQNYQEDEPRANADEVSEYGSDEDDNRSAASFNTTSSRNRRSDATNTSRRRTNISGHQRRQAFSGFQGANARQVHKQTSSRFSKMERMIHLDSGSTLGGTFMNSDLLLDIKKAKQPTVMTTNAGNKKLDLEGTLPGLPDLGPVIYDSSMITNLLGLAPLVDKGYRVTYDSDIEDAFNLHTPDSVLKFKRTPEGLYGYEPSQDYLSYIAKEKNMLPPPSKPTAVAASHVVSSVKENKLGYNKKQLERAKLARDLYHAMGCPTVENFKHILRQKIIKNCPVTTDDANLAEKIYGPDVGTLKGKSTRQRPNPVINDLVEIPPEILEPHHELTLCIDNMFVNGIPMLTTIDTGIRYRALQPLDSRSAENLYNALDKVLRLYSNAGLRIATINADGEFKTLMEQVADELDVAINPTAAQEHVPEAERNNRTIGERIRAVYQNLPFSNLPRVMWAHLAMLVTDQLNYFPAKGGASKYFSPHVLLKKMDLDYEKHCKIPFGSYVIANHEHDPKNTPATRGIDCIYLRPLNNKQGGHYLMHLSTGKLITRQTVTVVPITDSVIHRVDKLGTKQGMKSLKLETKDKQPLFPANWIAGVDYEDTDDNMDDNDEEYTESDTDEDSYDFDDELDDEESYDRMDTDEIDELLADETTPTDTNPITVETVEEEDDTPEPEPRRSTRETRQPEILSPTFEQHKQRVRFADQSQQKLEKRHNILYTNGKEEHVEYDTDRAGVIANLMVEIRHKVMNGKPCFGQQYPLHRGLKKFGDKGRAAAGKELDQLHNRNTFAPVDVSQLSPDEKRKAQEGMMLLTEKRDGTVKGRLVYNGKPTRDWHTKEETASPTVDTNSIMLTNVIDAKEGRDKMTVDVPNAFVQTPWPEDMDRVIMKCTGVLVDELVKQAPNVYATYVVYENGKKVIYLEVLMALYGMLVAALLWYRKFRSDLEGIGFIFNPYDPCVANRMINGKQQTIRFHVDDLDSSHMQSKVNDKFLKWLNEMYGSYGEVKATRGLKHEYLGMTFDYSLPGKVIADMSDYVKTMIGDFSIHFNSTDTAPTPALEDLFAEGQGVKLNKEHAHEFHTFVAKGLFACKRARPDIHTAITALCTRVKSPNQDDWRKLIRLMKYLNGTKDDKLILSADNLHTIKWYVDASFAVHPDFKSHTGAVMTFGHGAPISMSKKQKLNTRSSTEAELVGADDATTMILWTKLFMEAQGYEVKRNILYQDNKSTILLEQNGKRSSSKRTRAINIRYFFLTDQVEKGNLGIEYCPTTEMIGDYMTKPLQRKTI